MTDTTSPEAPRRRTDGVGHVPMTPLAGRRTVGSDRERVARVHDRVQADGPGREVSGSSVVNAQAAAAGNGALRVAYLVSRYPGISHTFIQREVAELRRRGVRVDTFTIKPVPEAELLTEYEREEAGRTSAVLPVRPAALVLAHLRAARSRPAAYASTFLRALRLSPGGVRGALWQLFYFAEAMLLHAELARREIRHVHVHFANVSADVAMLVSHYTGGRVSWSFTMHGPTELYDIGAHKLRHKIESARFVVCISDFARSQMMYCSGAEHWDKFPIVHCGVDPDHFDAPAAIGEPDRLRVLFVGRLVGLKGPDLLITAVGEMRADGRRVDLEVVGDGPDRQRLEALVRDLGLDGHVSFAGALGQDVIRERYARCDAFCLPSFAEGVPVVLMEAMAMRRPVVTTPVMGIPELVEHDVSGLLVRPGRVDAIVAALGRLFDDPALRVRLGEGARRKIEAEFDQRANAERLATVLGQELTRVGEG